MVGMRPFGLSFTYQSSFCSPFCRAIGAHLVRQPELLERDGGLPAVRRGGGEELDHGFLLGGVEQPRTLRRQSQSQPASALLTARTVSTIDTTQSASASIAAHRTASDSPDKLRSTALTQLVHRDGTVAIAITDAIRIDRKRKTLCKDVTARQRPIGTRRPDNDECPIAQDRDLGVGMRVCLLQSNPCGPDCAIPFIECA